MQRFCPVQSDFVGHLGDLRATFDHNLGIPMGSWGCCHPREALAGSPPLVLLHDTLVEQMVDLCLLTSKPREMPGLGETWL